MMKAIAVEGQGWLRKEWTMTNTQPARAVSSRAIDALKDGVSKKRAVPKKKGARKQISYDYAGALRGLAQSRSANPLDWLYVNPLGPEPSFSFGVLRKSYKGFKNSAIEFGGRKLRPIIAITEDGSPDPFQVTAYRTGTVLPKDAPDEYDEPGVLLKAMDAAECAHETALLVYVTLAFPEATRLHHAWEEARAFSMEEFARKRGLPVCLIQHRPGEVGSDNPAHVHLLIGARRLDGTGFRGFAHDLLCDDAQRLIHDAWAEFRAGR